MWILALILHSLYYISPAYCANALAIFGGGKPIDSGKTWRGKRILGDGKTWRGLLIGILAGTLFGLMWYYLSQHPPLNTTYYGVFDFRITDPFFGLYLGFGALFGDLVKSFFKRRVGIKRGRPWWGADQLDQLFGGLLFAWLFAPKFIIFEEFVTLIALTLAIHLAGNQIAYYTKRKKVRW
jgi:CDP-2,3-bis-(O-geranylgeranyl)-sn-glycerol synthase